MEAKSATPTALVVDDSRLARHVAEARLSALGFEVVEAEDGTVALRQLSQHPHICLMLTDLVMPMLSGTELIPLVRSLPVGAGLPIVAVTVEHCPKVVQSLLSVGADFVLPKPLEDAALVRCLQKLGLGVARTAAPHP